MDEGFLDALARQPNDNVARLVYADWLQEHDDPREEFLRLEVRLATNDFAAGERGALMTQLAELGRFAETGWLLAVNRTPFVRCRVHRRERRQESHGRVPLEGVVELANYATRTLIIPFDIHPLQYLHAVITDPINREWDCCYEGFFEDRARVAELRLFPGERYSANVNLLGAIPFSEIIPGKYRITAVYNFDEVCSHADVIHVEVDEGERRWLRENNLGDMSS